MQRSLLTTVAFGMLFCLAMLTSLGRASGQRGAPPPPSQTATEKAADAARIDRLIQQLGSDNFTERESASKALEAIGEAALPALRKAQANPDLEVRRRAGDLIRVQKQRRSAMRAKAWDRFEKIGNIDSDAGTPDGRIGGIHFNDRVRDEDLAWLPWLDDVASLQIMGTQFSDAGLVHVKNLSRMSVLDVQETKVTDAGLIHLKELDHLECLVLSSTRVTDAGLVHLKALKRLWFLNIGFTQITDAGLVHLKSIKTLGHLDLSHTRITDRGLDHVKEMKALSSLNLSHTQVTDAGLAKLTGLGLHSLDLSHTQVTDVGLARLREIRTLTMLRVNETKVTNRAQAEWLEKEKRASEELKKRNRMMQDSKPR